MKKKIELNILVPFLLMVVILLIFTAATGGTMLSAYNLKSLFDQTFLIVIAGLGTIFVVAQGGTDMSVGTTVGLSTVVAAAAADACGLGEWVIFPVVVLISLAQGAINGVLVSRFKVPSFMATLAMLIGVRGLINFIQAHVGLYYASTVILALKKYSVKVPALIVLVALAYYVLEYTRFGEYSKAIGENETVAVNIGIPVKKIKFLAFLVSSLMAGVAGLFLLAKMGGTTNTMGTNMEIEVVMGIFLGGVLVTGGYSARIEKLLIGSVTISIIKNGMVMVGLTATQVTESVRGILLMLILFVTIRLSDKEMPLRKRKTIRANK